MSDNAVLNPCDWAALDGCLLLVKPLQHLPDIDAVQADIHVLDGEAAGTVLRGIHVSPPGLQDQIRNNAEMELINLGRLGKLRGEWKLLQHTVFDSHIALGYLASEQVS